MRCLIRLLSLAVMAGSLGACGGEAADTRDLCQKLTDLLSDGMADACASHDGCCYCGCLEQDLDMTNPNPCTCIERRGEEPMPPVCEGEALATAERCFANVDSCRDSARATVELGCAL